jgi:hypothetical protein
MLKALVLIVSFTLGGCSVLPKSLPSPVSRVVASCNVNDEGCNTACAFNISRVKSFNDLDELEMLGSQVQKCFGLDSTNVRDSNKTSLVSYKEFKHYLQANHVQIHLNHHDDASIPCAINHSVRRKGTIACASRHHFAPVCVVQMPTPSTYQYKAILGHEILHCFGYVHE